MKTINIKGKDYVQVNERIKEFQTNPKYEDLCFETQKIKDEFVDRIDYQTGEVVKTRVAEFRCIVYYRSDKVIKVTGTAEEYENSSYINKTSFKENCETSAIGRALGNLGIGIDTSIASAEEVASAIANQTKKPAAPAKKPVLTKSDLAAVLKGTIENARKVLSEYEISDEYMKQITNKFKK